MLLNNNQKNLREEIVDFHKFTYFGVEKYENWKESYLFFYLRIYSCVYESDNSHTSLIIFLAYFVSTVWQDFLVKCLKNKKTLGE